MEKGNTGVPIVDACMTQLNKTGYTHNRGRMIVRSFLTKNLRLIGVLVKNILLKIL